MKNVEAISDEKYPDTHHDLYSKTVFGFWIYLLTDFVLFGTLFAAYAVLRHSTFGGAPAKELFDLSRMLDLTLILLASSFTAGLGGVYAHRKAKGKAIFFFIVTFLLGLVFLLMKCCDLGALIAQGDSWENSAFLSAYFTVIGTFLLHMVFALLWTVVLTVPVMLKGLSTSSIRRLTCLRMFWQFLNIVWIFIFTAIYLIGEIS